jgi:hypothetical protein
MGFRYMLEKVDGTPADPPTIRLAVRTCGPATRSRWDGIGRSESFRFGSTLAKTRCWSLRTCPKERLAQGADVS